MQKGFTLIELLVVIAIIAILSSVVLASPQTATLKAACAEGDRAACEDVGDEPEKLDSNLIEKLKAEQI